MADGDNLIIGRDNFGDLRTLLERSGTSINSALFIRNLNGHGLRAQGQGANPGFNGVWGETSEGTAVRGESTQGTGVVGISSSPTSQFAGVEGRGSDGPGVRALSDRGDAVEAEAKQGFAVRAQGVEGGVIAFARGDVAAGVTGVATRGVVGHGTEIGVYGEHKSVGGLVLSGFANVGVGGRSNAHHGVFGFSDAPLNPRMISAGVAGQSRGDCGVAGESLGAFAGVLGRCHDPSGAGVVGRSRNGVGVHGSTINGLAGTFDGDVIVDGNVWVTGGKSAVVKHRDGSHRALYAVESPESWFEDFGSARLVRGRAKVRLDRDFAALIRAADYHVFLTPEGDSQGLYVAGKTSKGFEVLEQQGGRSSLRFSFRIIARRPDRRNKRLERVRVPKGPKGLDRRVLGPKSVRRPAMPKPLKTAPKSRGGAR